MKRLLSIGLLGYCLMQSAIAGEGLIKLQSQYDVKTTKNKLIEALSAKGMNIMAEINHGKAAKNVDIELRDTELVIFGNPKAGSPLMQCAQSVAIDLPQKALIWQDEAGQVWLAYNDMDYLKNRHAIENCDDALERVKKALANFAKAATE